jgi:hypothetical protein
MPEICRFYGIIIQLYYGDHTPGHFHAIYGEHVAKIAIDTLDIIEGSIPQRAMRLVCERAELHERDLRSAFELASNFPRPPKIDPLP